MVHPLKGMKRTKKSRHHNGNTFVSSYRTRRRKRNGDLQAEKFRFKLQTMTSKAVSTHKKKYSDLVTPSAALIAQIHDKKEKNMETGSEEHVDYLLGAMDFLKNDTNTGQLQSYVQLYDQDILPMCMRNMDTTMDDPGTCECGGQVELLWDNSSEACVLCGTVSHIPLCHIKQCFPVMDSKRQQQTMTSTNIHFYRRDGHMKTLLLTVSGTSKSEIPATVLSKIRGSLKDYDNTKITPTVIGMIMKKNKLSKYYPQRFRLAEQMSGRVYTCHDINPDYRKALLELFRRVSEAYDIFATQCKEIRKNFLSYPFVFLKLNVLLGHPEYSDHVPLLKSRVRLTEQQRIWDALNVTN